MRRKRERKNGVPFVGLGLDGWSGDLGWDGDGRRAMLVRLQQRGCLVGFGGEEFRRIWLEGEEIW